MADIDMTDFESVKQALRAAMQRASALGLTGDTMKQYVLDETSSLRTSENVDAAWRALALVVANEPDDRWAERDSVKAPQLLQFDFQADYDPDRASRLANDIFRTIGRHGADADGTICPREVLDALMGNMVNLLAQMSSDPDPQRILKIVEGVLKAAKSHHSPPAH